jgi:hypothetical protein
MVSFPVLSNNPSLNAIQSELPITNQQTIKHYLKLYWLQTEKLGFVCLAERRTFLLTPVPWKASLGKVRIKRSTDADNRWSYNSTAPSRVVTGLLTGHNTMCRQAPPSDGLTYSPLCRNCVAEEEPSAHILCHCEALASIRHAYLGSYFLQPEDIKSQKLGAIWHFSKAAGLPWSMIGAQRACFF